MSNLTLPRMNKVSGKFRLVLQAAESATGVPVADITGKSRVVEVIAIRQVVQYILHVDCKFLRTDLALRFSTKRNAILHNVKRVTDLIEAKDPITLGHLESIRAAIRTA